jgi:iron complex outermembrane receptor protein
VPVSFNEETVNSYEIGAKFDIGDLRLNLAAFQADYSDIQLIFRQGVVPLLFNAGKARYRGLEGEFSYHPAGGFVLDGSFSFLDADIRSVTPIPAPAGTTISATVQPGDTLPFTPEFQGNFSVGYEFWLTDSLTFTPRFNGSYTSDLTFITGSVPIIEQEDYFVGDISVTLADEDSGWQLTAGVLNLFDERYLIQGNASLATLGYAERIYARPQNWYLQVGIDF